MIKIENRSPEDIANYGRRIGEAFAASPGIAETIPHDDLVKSFEIITEFYYRMGTLYATSEKYEGFSLHTGIRIPDSHSGLPYI